MHIPFRGMALLTLVVPWDCGCCLSGRDFYFSALDACTAGERIKSGATHKAVRSCIVFACLSAPIKTRGIIRFLILHLTSTYSVCSFSDFENIFIQSFLLPGLCCFPQSFFGFQNSSTLRLAVMCQTSIYSNQQSFKLGE